MRKRLDREPTDEELLESMQADRTGRNSDIIEFIKMLANTEGPYTYMIDAPWGDGKTFFIKSVSLVLHALNPQISIHNSGQSGPEEIIAALQQENISILPFYFNAWENDFADDPISALLACMAVEFNRHEFLKDSDTSKNIAALLDSALSLARIPALITTITNEITGRTIVEAFENQSLLRSRLRELCEASNKEVANTLVIFVDELDRCRPNFAVKLLEQTKNLFASSDIIFVFSTDSSQLAKAVAGTYGLGFDSSKYLEKFFDERITLTPVNSYEYCT